ncbi:MAG: mandelate racemase [Thermoleophilaceae bacterium]|nr:mandelate racemase [Thermoleophilaceae bacterium]
MVNGAAVSIQDVVVGAYRIPTDAPESDGTIAWDATTIIVAEVLAGNQCGLGYAYADAAAAQLIENTLASVVEGRDAMAVPGTWQAMVEAVRNLGRPGIASSAIAALDIALWDLKARLLGVSLATLLGPVREGIAIYGSGGFTSYDLERLQAQLGGWADAGIAMVKMKVGREPDRDDERVALAREAIGEECELFVDANGAYERKQALAMAEFFAQQRVSWFEEPVSSDDLAGLRLLRDRAPAGMAIAAGEYGYTLNYFRRMLEAGAVDVLQADVTRCAGITELLRVGALCAAHEVPLSAHTAPSIHAHAGCAIAPMVHLEYFHDHVRIERMLFDGVLEPEGGVLAPDLSSPGLGLELRRVDAEAYAL